MKEFTKEMLHTLIEADKQVRGTSDYAKYRMQNDYKWNGNWKFLTHTIPHKTGVIKTFKGKTYIITEGQILGVVHGADAYRFHVTDEVKALLNI
jgi:hypothetical protein